MQIRTAFQCVKSEISWNCNCVYWNRFSLLFIFQCANVVKVLNSMFLMLYEYDNWNHFWYFLLSLCLNLNQVKFSELTLDTFRMLQCLEWEPSGSFYQSSGAKNGQNGAPASSRINYSQDIADPTLPPNPRKAVLYRPSVTHFLAVSIMGNNLLICYLFLYSVFCYISF